MFSGIIQTVGKIEAILPTTADGSLTIHVAGFDYSDCQLGDSIAVNGVCLTVVSYQSSGFTADVSLETLSRTNLGQLKTGSRVNLEKALTLNSLLGGHLLSGHVDGLGRVLRLEKESRSVRYWIAVDSKLQHYVAEKGSIAIDGVSLTVNRVAGNELEVNILPYTQSKTIVDTYRHNTQVNIEVDIIARYLDRLITGRAKLDLLED